MTATIAPSSKSGKIRYNFSQNFTSSQPVQDPSSCLQVSQSSFICDPHIRHPHNNKHEASRAFTVPMTFAQLADLRYHHHQVIEYQLYWDGIEVSQGVGVPWWLFHHYRIVTLMLDLRWTGYAGESQ